MDWDLIKDINNSFPGFEEQVRATQDQYLLCKPKVCIFTWASYSQVMIFQGDFVNDARRPLDYVQRLKHHAGILAKQRIPVLFVYSNLDMLNADMIAMDNIFREQQNILTVCLERDLDTAVPFEQYAFWRKKSLTWMDMIRLLAIKHWEQIQPLVKAKAIKEFKTNWLNFLMNNGGNTIVYSDFDNDFSCLPDLWLKDGLGSGPFMPESFRFVHWHWSMSAEQIRQLPDEIRQRKDRHTEILSRFFQEEDPEFCQYLRSGRAVAETNYLIAEGKKIQPKAYGHVLSRQMFIGENHLLYVRQDQLHHFMRRISLDHYCVSVSFHVSTQDRTDNHSSERDLVNLDFWDEAQHMLVFFQLVKYFRCGWDQSWNITYVK